MAEMPFRIDPIITDELVLQFVEQLDKLEHKDVELAIMENLYSGERSTEFYEGLLAGYANAFNVVLQSKTGGRTGKELGRVVAFVASKVWELRPPSIHLRRHDRCVVVAGARSLKLKPAEFAFYALLARRRRSNGPDGGFVSWNTESLKDEYLAEYRRVADDGRLERVERSLPNIDEDPEGLRNWFEERKCNVNRQVTEQCGPTLQRICCIATRGQRPNVRSGLLADPERINLSDE